MFEIITNTFQTYVIEPIAADPIWTTILFIGQLIFFSRFVVQWIVSEYKKKSHVPRIFWYLSLVGSWISLIYFIHIKNPVLMLGFSLNTLIYLRNLHLIYKHAKKGIVTVIEKNED